MQGESRDGVPLASITGGLPEPEMMDALVEDRIAKMSRDEFDRLMIRTRPPGEDAPPSSDPKQRAADALKRQTGARVRGKVGTSAAAKQHAADMLRKFATGQ
jgi:hypothetical protein